MSRGCETNVESMPAQMPDMMSIWTLEMPCMGHFSAAVFSDVICLIFASWFVLNSGLSLNLF